MGISSVELLYTNIHQTSNIINCKQKTYNVPSTVAQDLHLNDLFEFCYKINHRKIVWTWTIIILHDVTTVHTRSNFLGFDFFTINFVITKNKKIRLQKKKIENSRCQILFVATTDNFNSDNLFLN